MPALHVLGSLNIDRVYRLARALREGETQIALGYRVGAGGKGANQSLAAARAGARVRHIGCVGPDGRWLADNLAADGVDVGQVRETDAPTGHAAVLVDGGGGNAIVVDPGANLRVTPEQAREALAQAGPGDWLLLQNETSAVAEAMRLAHGAGLPVLFNFAPFRPEDVPSLPLGLADTLILNEREAEGLCGQAGAEGALSALASAYPGATILLTRGAEGAYAADRGGARRWRAPSPRVEAVDTTAAGDTFIGYWAAARLEGFGMQASLERACRAAALCVSRPGAAESVPFRHEVDAFPPA